MARNEAIAVAGFYPLALHLMDRIVPFFKSGNTSYTSDRIVMDVCAGEGDAIRCLAKHVRGKVYAVEMEASRYKTLESKKNYSDKITQGDFFSLYTTYSYYGKEGGHILYLNPPYDLDKEHGRLEERFLKRATPLLREDGWLVFVVPYYALKASAETFSRYYTDLRLYKFPDEDFGVYKQVVLFARKVSSPFPDDRVSAQILSWSESLDGVAILPTVEEGYNHAPIDIGNGTCGIETWRCVGLDTSSLSGMDPWKGSTVHIAPDVNYQRTYPVASMPRASHLAAAMAAGIFNGFQVSPTGSDSLPPLLVKGVFDREWRKVEDKINNKGEKTAEVQVQAPKLSVCYMDLTTGKFGEVKAVAESRLDPTVDDLSMGDLMEYYGPSLMRGMLNSCPVLYDPKRDGSPTPIEGLARPLYQAQAEAVETILRMHDRDPQEGVVLMGEIGVGKSGSALAAAKALNIKKLLVVCPPHLLTGWGDQVKASVKGAESIVLDTISDIRRWQTSTASMAVGIMSRERAKLSHGWIPVERACPKCGGPLPTGKDLVKTRATCAIEYHKPKNKTASWVADIAYELASFKKGNAVSAALLSKRAQNSVATVEYTGPYLVHDKLVKLVPLMGEGRRSLLPFLCWADRDLIPLVLDTYYPVGTELDLTFYEILLMADAEVADTYKDRFDTASYYGYASGYIKHRKFLSDTTVGYGDYSFKEFSKGDDGIKYHAMVSESIEALDRFVQKLTQMSSFSNTVCGEFLYQAVPSPDRYPLAKWITKFAKDSFDMLIFDEAHEGSSPDSAQTKAVQRLMGANKAFKLLLTGSIMNGYAGSLFMNMRAISKKFKADFGMDAQTKFIDRYGYWKRVVSETDNAGKIVEWGSQSDRTMSSKRAGEAPGILPVFQLEYLLPNAVTLQKVDLKLNIPPCTEHVHDVEPTSLQESNYRYLLSELMDTIKATRYKPGLAGKLWGAMANLPGYLDLAASGEYELRWPDNCPDVGGSLIASVPSLDPDELLPKEDWMLSQIALSLSQGHRPMVLGWHTALLPRYLKIIEDAGYDVVWLDASKVGTAKRQDWIDKHVIKAKCQVLVVNPVVIQTGLNNLVYFSRQIWMENPVCNPITYRQAGGRIDRIGQTQDTEIHFPRYSNTAQIQAHKLLLHKVGVSQAVDGLDPEEALKSAGMIDSDFNGFSVGKQLYRMVCEG